MELKFFEPRICSDTKAFWERCKEHKLIIQKCTVCGRLRWPAAYLCPHCLSSEVELAEMSGSGELYSYTVFHKAFHPSLEKNTPYIVSAVDLEEGVRILSNLINAEGKRIRCGAAVKLKWLDFETYSKPVFELDEGRQK